MNKVMKEADNYYRGIAKLQLGKFKEAIKYFDKYIELNPQDDGVYNNRGIAKFQIGKFKEAIKDFDKSIEINPQLAESIL